MTKNLYFEWDSEAGSWALPLFISVGRKDMCIQILCFYFCWYWQKGEIK